MSGFTGSGYPKAVPLALARRISDANLRGQKFQVSIFTGASTGPELDGALAMAGGIHLRLPYQSDPETRKRINAGEMEYMDIHLSHVAQFVEYGFLGKLDLALIEVTAVLEDGRLVPSSSLGNNKTWIEQAERVIIEVNSWQPTALEGMHDIYYGLQPPPNRGPIPLTHTGQRIGSPYLEVPPEKVVAVVLTDSPDRNSPFKAPDEASRRIAGHILEFLAWEVKKGRMPANLLPLQSGVGNIANAVLFGLEEGPFEGLTSYTEVIQDGMIRLLKSGKLTAASATAFSLSPEMLTEVNADMASYRKQIVLRPQEISNHPEIIRRLGVIAMNGMIEADIYGNVNSTHVMGSRIQNGIGGSGDFARNGYLSIFMAPSTAQKGTISTIVPMVSHVDHTEHDVSGDRHRAGPGRPARTVAAAARPPHHREVRRTRLQAAAARLPQPRRAPVLRTPHPAPAERIAGLAQPLSALRPDAAAEGRLGAQTSRIRCSDKGRAGPALRYCEPQVAKRSPVEPMNYNGPDAPPVESQSPNKENS